MRRCGDSVGGTLPSLSRFSAIMVAEMRTKFRESIIRPMLLSRVNAKQSFVLLEHVFLACPGFLWRYCEFLTPRGRGANHFLKVVGLFYKREAISSFSGGLCNI